MPSPANRPDRSSHRLTGIAVPVLAVALISGGTAAVAVAAEHGASTSSTSSIATTGTLSVNSASVVQGATVAFSYSVPAAKVNSENWIGIYSNPGNGPVNQVDVGAATSWAYAAAASGTSSFSTSALAPGNYIAYYLYDNGYTWLASLGTGETSVHGGLSDPSDVALDGSGHAFVLDPDYGWVEEFGTNGPYLNEFGTAQPGLLADPHALAVNSAGDVFVADTGDNQIVEFAPGS